MSASRTILDAAPPRWIRAQGGVRLRVARTAKGSAPIEIAERGGYRVRFLRGEACEGVFVNTGGGMAGGDALALDVAIDEGAQATLTTQAAEKIYRAQGAQTTIGVDARLGAGARLDWIAQEQILFEGARLARRIDVAMAPDARLLLVESVVFGRLAMGERTATGAFRDRWRIRRGGRLVFAEDVRLEGAIGATLARKAVGDGAAALATCLYVAPEAESLVEAARGHLADARAPCAVGAVGGALVARFVAADPQAMRGALAAYVERLRGRPVPRSWSI